VTRGGDYKMPLLRTHSIEEKRGGSNMNVDQNMEKGEIRRRIILSMNNITSTKQGGKEVRRSRERGKHYEGRPQSRKPDDAR